MNKISVHYDKKRFSQGQNTAIGDALKLALQAHEGQLRANGEPYAIHPVAVAEIVAEWGLDHEAICAALLHDVVEDTDMTLTALAGQFGPQIAELVDGLTKMRLSASPRPSPDSIRLEISNENLRKLLLATSKNPRVILIKLADRLHNLRTLQYLHEEKRVQVARESLEIYAPVADRLGMGQLKVELEDLSFQFSFPEEFDDLKARVEVSMRESEEFLAMLKRAIAKHLRSAGVKVMKIEGRPKHLWSIRKKLVKTGGDLDKIYDLMAVRVLVPDVSACYQSLGVLHQHYKPLIYRIKDYIAVPKMNGYQSLHTTVFAEDGHITEIQIRTPDMHEAAEHGLAAHFVYDAHKRSGAYAKREAAEVLPESQAWVRDLADWQAELSSGGESAEGARLELFGDRIFVFSPKGDLYDLPEGATPLDFAFAVHSGIGLRAVGAKVNRRMVPLDTRLENRDVVEIVTRREPGPSRDWLGVVITSHAKNRIRAWFRAVSRDEKTASGRTALEGELTAWGVKRLDAVPKRRLAEAAAALGQKSVDDMYAAVGEGALGLANVIRKLIPDAAKPKGIKVVKRQEPTGRVAIEGTDLPYVLAPCCSPAFPQPLLGYVTRGKGVTVHALGCRNLPADAERYATCRWETNSQAPELLSCEVQVEVANRIGMLMDITGVVARDRLNIRNFATTDMADDRSRIQFAIEVPDLFVLARVMKRLKKLPGVTAVSRM